MTVLPDPPIEPPVAAPKAEPPNAARRRVPGRLVPFLAGLAVMLLVVLLVNALRPQPAPITRGEVQEAVASALASQTEPPPRAELIYAGIRPSVVLIDVTRTGEDGKETNAEGTGVVVTDQGEILTANHVVDQADTITLTFADGSESAGIVSSQDPEQDIAVVTADVVPRVPPAVLGNPDALAIGSDA